MAGEFDTSSGDRRQDKNSKSEGRGLFRGLFGRDRSEPSEEQDNESYDDSTKNYRPKGLLQQMREGRPVEKALRGLAGDNEETPFDSANKSTMRDRLIDAATKARDGFELFDSTKAQADESTDSPDTGIAPKAENVPLIEHNYGLAQYLEDPKNDTANLYFANSGVYELELIGNNKKVADNLQSLNASGTSLSNDGMDRLAGKTEYPKLTSLNLAYNEINDIGAAAFRNMPNLKQLDLSDNSISDEALTHLPKNKLEILQVRRTDISSAGLAALQRNQANLKELSLEEVHLGGNRDDRPVDESARVLAALAGMKSLTFLNLRGTELPAADVKKLKASLPKCVILAPDGTEL
ncbi:MAG: leucine-rich repeat domain-containing protein [Candidatus Obscuribacterales bacterium]|nr:leucine-rich repeat domain-containing protein [Candidatus Obscuribacterales bacterium]